MYTYKDLPLARLMRCPIEWAEAFAVWDGQGRVRDFLHLHLEMPASPLRDARIARSYVRLGDYEKAKQFTERHPQEPLCVAWYVAACVIQGGEEQIRSVLKQKNLQPTWSLLDETTRIEALYRVHLARASGFATLRMKESARTEFMYCLQYADILRDKEARNIAHLEMARADTFLDDLNKAKSIYMHALNEINMNAPAYDVCQENLVGLCWLTTSTPKGLNKWGRQLLNSLWLQPPQGDPEPYPEDVVTQHIGTALTLLQDLTQQFNVYLPLYYNEEARTSRQIIVDQILQLATRKYSDELTDFMVQTAKGLALTMTHDVAGLRVLGDALVTPINGVSVMVMAHFASIIQGYANLPHAQRDEVFQNAKRQLVRQYSFLPDGERKWLMWFMAKFTPVSLFLLTEMAPDQELALYLSRFTVVSEEGVQRGDGKPLSGYPRKFMLSHVQTFLAGERLPPDTSSYRVNAGRHKRFIEGKNGVYVVFRPLIDSLL